MHTQFKYYNMIIYRLIVKIKLRKLKIITKNLFYFYY